MIKIKMDTWVQNANCNIPHTSTAINPGYQKKDSVSLKIL